MALSFLCVFFHGKIDFRTSYAILIGKERPPCCPVFAEMFKGGLEKSQKLPELYEAVAKMGGAEFLNAGSVISTDGVDGLHLTAESERKLGVAVAAKVKEMFK